MKKSIFVLLVLLFVADFCVKSFAATIPPSATSTASPAQEKDLTELESKIASLAAEKHVSEHRGIIGTVTDVTSTQISLNDTAGNLRIIHVDELTKFSSDTIKGTFGISDITKGMVLGVLGLYYKDTRIIIARFITTQVLSQHIHGIITDIDSKNFTFNVQTTDNKQINIDVENLTKTRLFTKDKGEIRAGFSKIQPGETVIISGYKNMKNANQVIASFIILLPEIAKNLNIKAVVPSLTPSSLPSPTVTPTNKVTQ